MTAFERRPARRRAEFSKLPELDGSYESDYLGFALKVP